MGITTSHILTAAHCLDDKSAESVFVSMGDHDETKKEIHEQIIQGDKIFIHEAFNVRNIKNDIAIMKLKTPFVLHERRQTIRLMPDKDFLQRLYSKNKALSLTVLGWGASQLYRATSKNFEFC